MRAARRHHSLRPATRITCSIIIKTGVKEHTHAHVRRQENEASLACNAQKITTPSATQIYGMFIAAMQQHRSNSSARKVSRLLLGRLIAIAGADLLHSYFIPDYFSLEIRRSRWVFSSLVSAREKARQKITKAKILERDCKSAWPSCRNFLYSRPRADTRLSDCWESALFDLFRVYCPFTCVSVSAGILNCADLLFFGRRLGCPGDFFCRQLNLLCCRQLF